MPSDVMIQSSAKSVWPPPHIGPHEEGRRYHLTARLPPHYKLVIRKMHEAAKWEATYQRGRIYRFFIGRPLRAWSIRVLATAPVVIRHVSAISETRELREPRCRSCRGGQMGD